MPMSYIIDQRKLSFLKKIRTSDNTVLRSFSIMCAHEYGKYCQNTLSIIYGLIVMI